MGDDELHDIVLTLLRAADLKTLKLPTLFEQVRDVLGGFSDDLKGRTREIATDYFNDHYKKDKKGKKDKKSKRSQQQLQQDLPISESSTY